MAESEPDYYRALGKFIEEYAEAEFAMLSLLWSLTRVRAPIGRAIFSGTRSADATKYINRIFDVSSSRISKLRNDFEPVAAQLGHIRDARNLIIHNETVRGKDGQPLMVTNRRVALDKERLIERPISATILREMTEDLEKVTAHFILLLFRAERMPEREISVFREAYEKELRASFQYKPPPTPHMKQTKQKRPDHTKRKVPSGQR